VVCVVIMPFEYEIFQPKKEIPPILFIYSVCSEKTVVHLGVETKRRLVESRTSTDNMGNWVIAYHAL
jgi:hypothetical protein